MNTDFGKKLLAVLDVNELKLFSVQGLKIVENVGNFTLDSASNKTNEKRHSGFFAPHTPIKDITIHDASKVASGFIEKELMNDKDFKELIIVCDSKLLGSLRHELSKNTKKFVSKEINKDLMHHTVDSIEKAIFGLSLKETELI